MQVALTVIARYSDPHIIAVSIRLGNIAPMNTEAVVLSAVRAGRTRLRGLAFQLFKFYVIYLQGALRNPSIFYLCALLFAEVIHKVFKRLETLKSFIISERDV